MRKEFIECGARATAKKRCPWACKILKVCGGFYCYESAEEYRKDKRGER